MRMLWRSAVTLGLTLVGALALAGVAPATSSNVTFEFAPDQVPKKTYNPGKLSVHTHTDYTSTGQKTDRAQLNFDDDLKIRTKRIPRCDKARISGNITMKQAMSTCGTAKVGTGTALANAAAPGDTQACVLAFNGKPSHRRPTLLLFTRVFLDRTDPRLLRSGRQHDRVHDRAP